ncbi:MAG: NAD-dependent deacylase [Nitrososphaerales archaeon]|nr:NAD-dependent deacylase [Nitrososphaerales archaeon]
MNILKRLGLIINPKLRVTVLTGAGISIESGVPIFRGKGSMWEIPEARRLAMRAGPPWNNRETWEFYEWRRRLVSQCKPNAAHYTLVEMENYFENFCLITQNVDGLHTKAGSKKVLELHGNMWKGRCMRCGKVIDLPETPLKSLPPYCDCGYPLRPHVVQFGEPIDNEILIKAINASKEAELFLVIGTSGVVSPASQMPLLALENGAKVIEINPNPTVLTPYMSLSIREKAAEALPRLWKGFFTDDINSILAP